MLVRRQADAFEIIVALAASSNGKSGFQTRTKPPPSKFLHPRCTGLFAERFRQFRSALAPALPRSNRKMTSSNQRGPLGEANRARLGRDARRRSLRHCNWAKHDVGVIPAWDRKTTTGASATNRQRPKSRYPHDRAWPSIANSTHFGPAS